MKIAAAESVVFINLDIPENIALFKSKPNRNELANLLS